MPDADHGAAQWAWVTVAEAARRLGCSERAVRKRVERGRLQLRREGEGNRVRTLVRVPAAEPVTAPGAESAAERAAEPAAELVRTLWEQVARLEERAAQQDRLIERLTAEVERERTERREERERVDRLLAVLAERRPERRPWPGFKAWWRRLIEGEGRV